MNMWTLYRHVFSCISAWDCCVKLWCHWVLLQAIFYLPQNSTTDVYDFSASEKVSVQIRRCIWKRGLPNKKKEKIVDCYYCCWAYYCFWCSYLVQQCVCWCVHVYVYVCVFFGRVCKAKFRAKIKHMHCIFFEKQDQVFYLRSLYLQ